MDGIGKKYLKSDNLDPNGQMPCALSHGDHSDSYEMISITWAVQARKQGDVR